LFSKPTHDNQKMVHRTFDLAESITNRRILAERGDAEFIDVAAAETDVYSAATKLAAVYRFDVWKLKDQLAGLYPNNSVPERDLVSLAEQLERHTSNYRVRKEEIEVALALVKPDGFDHQVKEDGTEIYTAEISYPVSREHLLISWQRLLERNPADFGFHFDPYNFDSRPEADFFERMLDQLNLQPGEIEDIYFTGAFTSSNKTDFLIEYRDVDGHWRNYSPDFVIRKRPENGYKWGKCLIVELKATRHKAETAADFERDSRGEACATKEGSKAAALRKWTNLNPERLKYEILYVDTAIPDEEFDKARTALNEL
jgi:type III restriction enzyme